MRTLKRQILGMMTIFAVLLLLAGCGGGGEDEDRDTKPPANMDPTAEAGDDQAVNAGDTVMLDGSGSSDSDGRIVSYQWAQIEIGDGPTVSIVDTDEAEASASFVAPVVNATVTLMFQLTVTDDDDATDNDEVRVTVEPVTMPPVTEMVSLSGTVTDHVTGGAIVGAEVTVYQGSMPLGMGTTDATGAYEIEIEASPGRTTVKVEADNFAPQSVVVDLPEDTDAVSADLDNVLAVGTSGNFDPAQSIDVMGDQGLMLVRVPANSLVTKVGGAAPAGMVKAEVTVLDPSDPIVMPGDFMAFNATTGELDPIESFGAMDVRFEDDNGEPLTLGPGQMAEISIPLASNKIPANAPATLPMFYWSDEMGHWIEEGSATFDMAKVAYVGNVSHFTIWNVDEWVDTIEVSGCVEDSDGNPVIGAWVYTQGAVDFNGWSAGTTDPPDGRFEIPVGQNMDIVLSVLKDAPWVRPRAALASSDVFRAGSLDMTLPSCLVVPAPGAFVLDVSALDNPSYQLQ